ncbi:HesA/MoeB/ThiF family protein [Shimwellia blattae]|uniref:Adenylyltransferase ThiF n=1 Tax=Shimwellia blattae (strain ATCC 29907 / DSM 4481 / JCM 1650 / NBRC 105725 / CDC 9005-74) TaxID=630626 RepID=I2BE08_SHIBC|nr:HesA/MoeB/ThiF family protein [Shimwellia blattae]AFJ48762.1 adenylyltransferase ThiF [Shimwellia blattae DSM 4481 = NBRC 105725]GAB83075.1 sulfur carrier protein ThiS adenylyltransferase [Shimwellia blattae DSM 4481 = NBRC 105725]VDY66248.1 Sulfur carrier protein ThiS adenylyltransferase [Shimwellia blattae]VEC27506.1 Sulfur carrier protein ThiS adenylyltransferase [Shimwellia blattae]
MNDADFMRYSRQLLLEEIALEGQQKLLASQVLIIGLGGLGSPAALYLAGAGVGHLVVADDDTVHISNLQRQILFSSGDLEQPKAKVAKRQLERLNPAIRVDVLHQRLSGLPLRQAVARADLVLDCTDNMAARQEINAACVALDTPLISASAVGFSGQLMVLTPPWSSGCYRCLWPEDAEPALNCRTAGIPGPVVGIMGTLQALEALKLLSGMAVASGKLQLFDARALQWRTLALRRAPDCPVCGGHHADPV